MAKELPRPEFGHHIAHEPLTSKVTTYVPTGSVHRIVLRTIVQDGVVGVTSIGRESHQGATMPIDTGHLHYLATHITEHGNEVRVVVHHHEKALAGLGAHWVDPTILPEPEEA